MKVVKLAYLARSRVSNDRTESKYAGWEPVHSFCHQLFGLVFGLLVRIKVPTVMMDRGLKKVPSSLSDHVSSTQVSKFPESPTTVGEPEEVSCAFGIYSPGIVQRETETGVRCAMYDAFDCFAQFAIGFVVKSKRRMDDVALQGSDAERPKLSNLVGSSSQNGNAPSRLRGQQELEQLAPDVACASS
jgi:hypothetical protein